MAASLLLTSCFRPEEPIAAYDRGSVQVSQVDMGNDYRYQVYFDLSANSIVGQNLKADWDLGFEAGDSHHVILNFSKFMRVSRTGSSDFMAITDTSGMLWRWDDPSGDLDKTGVGEWADFSGPAPVYTNEVFVIDRGTDHLAQPQGLRKIQLLSLQDDMYTFRFANLDGTGEHTVQVAKDSTRNFTYFSFGTNTVVDIEPPKAQWDLLFTQYIHVFVVGGDTLPYLVTGVLTNWSDVAVAEDSLTPFPDISSADITSSDFSSNIDVIGYDWKYFDFGTLKYTVRPDLNYIIRDPQGFYYKLHFTDFYNVHGEKGSPMFEFRLL
jgi:hypothetical protein